MSEGFDFDAPQNIRGVSGARGAENIHQEITNQWGNFQRWFPNATRAQIEAFADAIDIAYGEHYY